MTSPRRNQCNRPHRPRVGGASDCQLDAIDRLFSAPTELVSVERMIDRLGRRGSGQSLAPPTRSAGALRGRDRLG